MNIRAMVLILILASISSAHGAKPYDLVCGRMLKAMPAFDDTGETILKIERQTQLTKASATFRMRYPQTLRGHQDAVVVRNVAKTQGSFCAQTFDGLHLSKFSITRPAVQASRIPGLSTPAKAKL